MHLHRFLALSAVCVTLVACQPRQPSEPIVAAVANNDALLVKEYLASGGDPNEKNRVGDPLLFVTSGESFEVSKLLVEGGADVNGQSNSGRTILMSAASWCDVDLVTLLIKSGADVNKAGDNGSTPLQVVCKQPAGRRSEVIALLKAAGANGD
jgi:ankyrin repeat protein